MDYARDKKVCSHIDVGQAPVPFFWEYNELADTLATQARTRINRGEEKKHPPLLFQVIRIGCKIADRLYNNNLYTQLKEHINVQSLENYLCNKFM